jgi:uncharacterized membrane protein
MELLIKKGVSLFIQGLLALFPIIVTVYVVGWFLSFVMRIAGNFLVLVPKELRSIQIVEWSAQLFVIIIIVALLMLFGLLVRTIFGKNLINLADRFIGSIPVVKILYKTSKQVIDLFSLRKTSSSMRPVLVEYPSPGIWMVAFNTGPAGNDLSPDGADHCTVFIPTTPNPTSGFLCVIPTVKIRPLGITTEQALKIILTAGAVKK